MNAFRVKQKNKKKEKKWSLKYPVWLNMSRWYHTGEINRGNYQVHWTTLIIEHARHRKKHSNVWDLVQLRPQAEMELGCDVCCRNSRRREVKARWLICGPWMFLCKDKSSEATSSLVSKWWIRLNILQIQPRVVSWKVLTSFTQLLM